MALRPAELEDLTVITNKRYTLARVLRAGTKPARLYSHVFRFSRSLSVGSICVLKVRLQLSGVPLGFYGL